MARNCSQQTYWKEVSSRLLKPIAVAMAGTPLWPSYLALSHSYLPVSIWRGDTLPRGRPGSVLVVGREPWVSHVPERIFKGKVLREPMGRYPIWALPERMKRLRGGADLTIIRTPRMNSRLFPATDYLHSPEWIRTRLSLPEDPHTPIRFGKNLRGGDLKVIRLNRLQASVSRADADFDEFYRRMHVPFVRNRFGSMGSPKRRKTLHASFRRGAILWIHRDGERLSAAVMEKGGQKLVLRALGTAGGRTELVKQGVLAAVYYYTIRYARQWGCAEIDLGLSRALLQDGVLRHKQKWGASLVKERPSDFDVLIRWGRLGGTASDFLSHSSPIFREPGGFAAVHAMLTDGPAGSGEARKARNALWIEGLKRLYLVGAAGWEPGATAPPGTALVDGRDSGGFLFRLNGGPG